MTKASRPRRATRSYKVRAAQHLKADNPNATGNRRERRAYAAQQKQQDKRP